MLLVFKQNLVILPCYYTSQGIDDEGEPSNRTIPL